jgi:lysophospholipase L1-like esterase
MAATFQIGSTRGLRLPLAAPLLTGACAALCALEARVARSGPRPYEQAHPADAVLGPPGAPVRVTWLGDSLAAGLGVDAVADTPAHVVAQLLERPVEVRMLAVPGARTVHVLADQIPRLARDTDLIVLSVGANDVACSGSRVAFAHRVDAILAALAPISTVVLSIPDMATPDRMAEPLRSIVGARARWFDLARARVAATHAHVHSVDVASPPAGMTRRQARAHLSADRFHPGVQAYRVWAERIAAAAELLLPPLLAPQIAPDLCASDAA